MKLFKPLLLASVLVIAAACKDPKPREEASTKKPTVASSETHDGGTSVAIAIDFSKSFAPFDAQKQTAIRALMAAINRAFTDRWPSGTVYLSAVGSSSLGQVPPCGPAVTYRQTLVPSALNQQQGRIVSKAVLAEWIEECVSRVVERSKAVEGYTDISGAIALAADWARTTSGRKLLCVFSDFVEDLPRGAERANFKLNGERVLMLWAPQSTDLGAPNKLFERLSGWEQAFSKAGASAVSRLQIAGLTSEQVSEWIQ
jgi:hypothetical protein